MYTFRHFIIFAFFSVISYGYHLQSEHEIPIKATQSEANPVSGGAQVDVKLYYECLCLDCIAFDTDQFSKAVEKLNQYVDFHVYPYGNAVTIKRNGTIVFECQHGPQECYGNKLHACAIDVLQNNTKAILFNACMMQGDDGGSNDAAADECAPTFGTDSKPIKDCAKGDRGTKLLEYYGEESKKANFSYVPYILINGEVSDGDQFMKAVCAAFATPPPPCVDVLLVD